MTECKSEIQSLLNRIGQLQDKIELMQKYARRTIVRECEIMDDVSSTPRRSTSGKLYEKIRCMSSANFNRLVASIEKIEEINDIEGIIDSKIIPDLKTELVENTVLLNRVATGCMELAGEIETMLYGIIQLNTDVLGHLESRHCGIKHVLGNTLEVPGRNRGRYSDITNRLKRQIFSTVMLPQIVRRSPLILSGASSATSGSDGHLFERDMLRRHLPILESLVLSRTNSDINISQYLEKIFPRNGQPLEQTVRLRNRVVRGLIDRMETKLIFDVEAEMVALRSNLEFLEKKLSDCRTLSHLSLSMYHNVMIDQVEFGRALAAASCASGVAVIDEQTENRRRQSSASSSSATARSIDDPVDDEFLSSRLETEHLALKDLIPKGSI